MLLAAAAALVVGALMYLSLVAAPTGPLCLLGGPGWAGWSNGLSQQAAVHQVLSADAAGIRTARLEGSAAETAVRMEPGTAAELAGVAADAMSRVGWRAGIRFASFGEGPGAVGQRKLQIWWLSSGCHDNPPAPACRCDGAA